MKDKNYRKIYENYFNIKIPKNFDVHHIDLDHYNNDISNLVMIPNELHNIYHKLLNIIPNELNINKELRPFGNGYNSYLIDSLIKFNNVYEECYKWLCYREYLKGNMPNIFNIDLGDYYDI